LIGFFLSSLLTPRYAISALIQIAKIGGGESSSSVEVGFSPFLKSGGNSSIKQEAISYIEFDYISGAHSKAGIHLTEVKDEKSTDLIKIVAEGSEHKKIKAFLGDLIKDLQGKYQGRINDIVKHSNTRIHFLKTEIASLQSLMDDVEKALDNVGPSPTLVVQMMDLKHDMVKLKQELLSYEANFSPEKIHNFEIRSAHLVNGGNAVWPKRGSMTLFAMILGMAVTAFIIFIVELSKFKRIAKEQPSVHDIMKNVS